MERSNAKKAAEKFRQEGYDVQAEASPVGGGEGGWILSATAADGGKPVYAFGSGDMRLLICADQVARLNTRVSPTVEQLSRAAVNALETLASAQEDTNVGHAWYLRGFADAVTADAMGWEERQRSEAQGTAPRDLRRVRADSAAARGVLVALRGHR
jgi:hypothetical protein